MNIEDDKLIKEMIKSSAREITNADFDRVIMNKIMIEDRKKYMMKRSGLYFLVIIAITIPASFMLKNALLHLRAGGLDAISGNIIRAGEWISGNTYLAVPFIILFLFKGLIAFKLKYV